jgi:cold shock protein
MSFSNRPQFRSPSPAAHLDMGAVVKWFDPRKGFGFVSLDDGRDAFLHMSALQSSGIEDIVEGARLVCDLGMGGKGLQVLALRLDGNAARPVGQDAQREGTVKFFDEAKGFGFVTPLNGARDVFFHVTALNRSGMQSVSEGQPVRFVSRMTQKGEEVVNIQA